MRAIGNRRAWFALGLACICACQKHDLAGKPSAASASATPSSAPAASVASGPSAVPHLSQAKPACRALAVTGLVTVEGAPLSTAALLDGAHWVELGPGASVALRHTQTSREFKLVGPGHALPCRDGSEQILLADGQLTTSANLGARPGAEVLIATPEGVVHYGDAALDLAISAKGLRVRVKQGEAWLEPEERGKPPFKNPVRSGREASLPGTRPKTQSLVDACQSAAETAADRARRVLGRQGTGGSDSPSLGVRAATHMRERAKARTACAIAAAAAYGESDPAKRQSLSALVVQADELWQIVPRAAR
ncbi:MAG TPA: hypothetical protein VJV79_16215 [Polyangiaceae bacterium]|nr:hypothetical protein [Polyangiaceae bacterium]